jgi:hypothetical protein
MALEAPGHPVTRCGGVVDAPLSGRAVVELVKRYCARAGVDAAEFNGPSLRAG